MGSYWDHRATANYTFVVCLLAILGAVWHFTQGFGPIQWIFIGLVGIPSVVLGYPAIRLGAMFPDVDSPSSIPYRRVMKSLPIFGFIIGAIAYIDDTEVMQKEPTGLLITGVLGAVFSGIFRYLYRTGIRGRKLRPKHRGKTHESKTAASVSKWIYRTIWFMSRGLGMGIIAVVVAMIFSGWFYIGYLSHLIRDFWGPKRSRP